MHKVFWDSESSGVILSYDNLGIEINEPPRPVFYEELDLLGFDKLWSYPRTHEPLLWASGRNYYYKGRLVARAVGGSMNSLPKIELTDLGRDLKLDPINIQLLVEKNKDALFTIENEAMDFVTHVYKVYKKKSSFVVSYSGGKDSQVVLDLVTRVIPPDELTVIFSDTTMDISYTHEAYEKTKQEYQKRYDGLKFYKVEPNKAAVEFWKDFGPPSRLQRWCCTVIKSSPAISFMRKQFGRKSVVNFVGVRSDESTQREKHRRLSEGEKHAFQINAEVIKDWNTTEVFLYMLYRKIYINKGYRYGLTRIGCSVCPFNSVWSESLLRRIESDIYEPYIIVLKEFLLDQGVEPEKLDEYIYDGAWKKRAGSESSEKRENHLEILEENEKLIAVIRNPKQDFLEWVKVVGQVAYFKNANNVVKGDVRVRERNIPFEMELKDNKTIIRVTTYGDKNIQSTFKNLFNKTTYCVGCGTCGAECPVGALTFFPSLKVNANLCIHCGNCVNVSEKGCLVAKSLQTAQGGRNMNNDRLLKGFGRYLTFGMRDEWLSAYLKNVNKWFEENTLGPKQVESMKAWLMDSGLIDSKKKPTELAEILSRIYPYDKNFVWLILWNNLYYTSSVCKVYVDNVEWGAYISSKDFEDMVSSIDPELNDRTKKSGIGSLLNMFENSPLSKEIGIGQIKKNGNQRFVSKKPFEEPHPFAVAYSLYKAAEYLGYRDLTVSEVYDSRFDGGPYKLFGIPRSKLERVLRRLQEDPERILKIDLVSDLDNIFLRDDLDSLQILRIAEARIK
ncbi:phosphoadenosine phosphosulfate reductase family protein [Fervidobacterium gondwanense]|uniref:Phosphoadenosine phosphosulfate reductase n=1 Tax=Fervidobacterium gondwanense DSM 13020 TaxID=1121883 RepID=A0A1M7T7B3_FERGO|nr:phosphoadenosine phosphosulfate reductase family protein [Fervidobacterium gondwanense]SHN66522.1 phosphoadenosine phosphosulfate reductase [Fervidobacterium gondwanense DSM 13020]